MDIHPYLFFSGNCREAMTRYHELLGGRLDVMTMGQLPDGEQPPPGASADSVMHAALVLDDGALIMASDDPTGDGSGIRGAAISLMFTDDEQARRVFDGLSEGGQVHMPLGETFWAPLFGMCADRFGASWMVNVVPADEEAS